VLGSVSVGIGVCEGNWEEVAAGGRSLLGLGLNCRGLSMRYCWPVSIREDEEEV